MLNIHYKVTIGLKRLPLKIAAFSEVPPPGNCSRNTALLIPIIYLKNYKMYSRYWTPRDFNF